MGWRRWTVRTALAGAALVSASVPSHALTIQQALALAYDSNPQLNEQRAATRAADEAIAQAKAGFRPTVTADADFGVARSVTNGVRTDTSPYGYGATVTQRLFSGFQTVNRVEVAEARIRASRETLRSVEQAVLQTAARAYVDVLQTLALLDIRRQNIAFLSEEVRSSRARLEVGEGTRTDVAQSRARLALARAELSAAEAQLAAARATFNQVVGRPPSNLRWPKGPVRLVPHTLSQAQVMATTQHPGVREAQYAEDAAAFQVRVEEGAFLPTVALQGRAQKRYNQGRQGTESSNLSATVNVTVPIYQGGAASATVRQAKETQTQARIAVNRVRDQVRAEAVTAWTQLQAARANLAANRQQVSSARLALSGVVEERNVGQRTQLDVLIAQNTVLQAEELLVIARANRVNSLYALAAATGRLNSHQLNLHVDHYDPKEHYRAVKDLWYGLRTPTGR